MPLSVHMKARACPKIESVVTEDSIDNICMQTIPSGSDIKQTDSPTKLLC